MRKDINRIDFPNGSTFYVDNAQKRELANSGHFILEPSGSLTFDMSKIKSHGWQYEAIFKHWNIRKYSGGLTRTETRPAQIDRWQGARVGHQ